MNDSIKKARTYLATYAGARMLTSGDLTLRKTEEDVANANCNMLVKRFPSGVKLHFTFDMVFKGAWHAFVHPPAIGARLSSDEAEAIGKDFAEAAVLLKVLESHCEQANKLRVDASDMEAFQEAFGRTRGAFEKRAKSVLRTLETSETPAP